MKFGRKRGPAALPTARPAKQVTRPAPSPTVAAGGTEILPAAAAAARGDLPWVYLDEGTLRAHNALADKSIYRRETSETTGIWDLPFRGGVMLDRATVLGGGGCEGIQGNEKVAVAIARVVRIRKCATSDDIARVTSAKYRQWLEGACATDTSCGGYKGDDGTRFLDGDKTTLATQTTVDCARYGAGSVLAAASRVFARDEETSSSSSSRAFVLTRPPGHHNSCIDLIEEQFDIDEDTPGNFVWGCHGGCVYNNVAMAIRMLQHHDTMVANGGGACDSASPRLLPRRFAVVDIDAHFGDGTALQFWYDKNVLTISIHWSQHEDGTMFPFLQGGPAERGGDGAEGTNLNLPLPDGSGDAALSRAIGNAILKLHAFDPDGGIFVACGFDGLDDDPSSKLCFTPAGYGSAVAALVAAFPKLPLLALWEGGYTEQRQADAFEAVVRALSSHGFP